MKQFMMTAILCWVLLSLTACSGSGGGSNPPAQTPQIVPNGTYNGTYQTVPALMAVNGLSATITITGFPSNILGAFNANIVSSASSATTAICYNGTMTVQQYVATYTITNCVYTNNVFSGILSNGAIPVNVTFTAA
jgi:hypothetical protein